jgi:rod shape determining protein RodA
VLFGAAVLYCRRRQPAAVGDHHVMRFAVFLAMAVVISRLRAETFKFAAFPAYIVIILLLILVEALGFVGGGSQRWLNLGFMTCSRPS